MKMFEKGYGVERLDWWNLMAKVDGVDSATPKMLGRMYGEVDVEERMAEVMQFIADYKEPGTKIGAFPW